MIHTFLDSLGDGQGDREVAVLVDDKVEIIERNVGMRYFI